MGLKYNLFNNTTQLLEEKVQTINHQSSPPFITFLVFCILFRPTGSKDMHNLNRVSTVRYITCQGTKKLSIDCGQSRNTFLLVKLAHSVAEL